MFGLFVSLALLGLAAIDPIGIAAMPILLVQARPLRRSFTFLGGSFVSLMLMGLLFARGAGAAVLRFENAHAWLVPSVEVLAGLVLLGIAATLLRQIKTGRLSVEPSTAMVKRLQFGGTRLFVLGALLVAVQSIADVVFVIAMIRIGQLKLSAITLTLAVAIYAVTALVLQFAVIVAYWLAPEKYKRQTLARIHDLLIRYANQTLIGASLLLGFGLLVNGGLIIIGAPHL
ncbi:MAG TPA: GAP family protein [Verrucomicrobiae bacterium]|nr:GAP family protein [Verrucomicrobiae bacterium]